MTPVPHHLRAAPTPDGISGMTMGVPCLSHPPRATPCSFSNPHPTCDPAQHPLHPAHGPPGGTSCTTVGVLCHHHPPGATPPRTWQPTPPAHPSVSIILIAIAFFVGPIGHKLPCRNLTSCSSCCVVVHSTCGVVDVSLHGEVPPLASIVPCRSPPCSSLVLLLVCVPTTSPLPPF